MFKNLDEMRADRPIKWLFLSVLRAAIVGVIMLVIVIFAFLLIATIMEFRPKEREEMAVTGSAAALPADAEELTVMTWDIGYGALGDNADYFSAGGHSVRTADRERVQENMEGIIDAIRSEDADVLFLQETDKSSARSSRIDETELLAEAFPSMEQTFAADFKAFFVPYPLPPVGKVYGGITTMSEYGLSGAERISLPCHFKWPVRTMDPKRCLLVSRMPAGEDGKELVLINLQLEANDDGEGKAEQTEVLKTIMEEEAAKGNYVIAGGDFNQAFSTVDGSLYPQQEGLWAPGAIDAAEFGSGWQLLMDDSVPTCRSLDRAYENADKETFQYYMIDGFIVSDNLEVVSCETRDLGFADTDHNPVVLKVRLG